MLKKDYLEKWPFNTVDENGDICVSSDVCSAYYCEILDSQAWLANCILTCVERVREVHNVIFS